MVDDLAARNTDDGAMQFDTGETPEEQRLFRQVMGRFATGITVVTTTAGNETFGMTANAFMAGSLVPPLCIISIRSGAQMHARLVLSGRFGVSLLNAEQQHLSGHFAGRRFDGIDPDFIDLGGMPVLNRAIATLTCDISTTAECGDHSLFIGRIKRMRLGSGAPLLFYGGNYAFIDRQQSADEIEAPAFW